VHGVLSGAVGSGQLSAAAKALMPIAMQKAAITARAADMAATS